MKTLVCLLCVLSLLGCSSEEKESDKLLTNYKDHHLEKAKQAEQQINQRAENLEQQLKEATTNQEDDPQL
ncbi:MAG: hypothetical protein HWD86_02060 [Kangiellaceae bacterium]|nr:hypothetical protein [Kangiellaceae bacterium]